MNNKNPLPDRPESQQPAPEGVNDNDWFDDLLKTPVTGEEIGEDEHAESLGLTPFSEQELEKIIQETLSEDWMSLEDEAALPETQEEFRDEEFRNTFGTNDILNPAYYTDNGELPEEVKDIFASVQGLGGIFDPANYVMAGADAMEGAKVTLPYLSYIHIKDAEYASQTILPAGEGEGHILEVLDMVNDAIDAPVMLTLEPHLNAFTAFKSIDTHELKGKYSFKNNTESFDFAVKALEALLEKGGYKKENGRWRK